MRIQNSNNVPECLKNKQLRLISMLIIRARAKIDYLMVGQNCSLELGLRNDLQNLLKEKS